MLAGLSPNQPVAREEIFGPVAPVIAYDTVDEAVIPFGGIKASGSGGHFGGARANLETFGHLQWVTMQSEIERYPF